MARIIGKQLIGSIGPVTFKKSNKGTIVSKKAVKVKQTAETKKSATLFGYASKLAGHIRYQNRACLVRDGGSVNRLNTQMRSLLAPCYNRDTDIFSFSTNSFNSLVGFEFNANTPFKQCLFATPEFQFSDSQLSIGIPELTVAQQLNFPAGSDLCEMVIERMEFILDQGYFRHHRLRTVSISKHQATVPAQQITMPVAKGALCLINMGLHYYQTKNDKLIQLNSLECSPAMISYVTYNEGAFSEPLRIVSGNSGRLLWGYGLSVLPMSK